MAFSRRAGMVALTIPGWLLFSGGSLEAATISPPLLDIQHQCNTGRHNTSAMSECIVAESEARAAILQKWGKISDADAERCVKAGRKAKRLPYSLMAKCLSVELAGTAPGPETTPH